MADHVNLKNNRDEPDIIGNWTHTGQVILGGRISLTTTGSPASSGVPAVNAANRWIRLYGTTTATSGNVIGYLPIMV